MSPVVFAWGNDWRGDDGIGPALAVHIEAQWPQIDLVTGFQLQLEHALDLADHDVALFIDAGRATPSPYRFYETAAKPGLSSGSHALAPESVLDVASRIGIDAPHAFVLCVAGTDFELGQPLSASAEANLAAAQALLDQLLAVPDPSAWRGLCDRLLANTSAEICNPA